MSTERVRLLTLMRPAMGILPEVTNPERKVISAEDSRCVTFYVVLAAFQGKDGLDWYHFVCVSCLLPDPSLRCPSNNWCGSFLLGESRFGV